MKKSTPNFLRLLMYLLLITASINTYAQTLTISGKVSSSQGEPLPGVNIIVKGTTIGTVSDVDGNYSLPVPELTGTLIFSYIGFTSVEVPINDQTSIDVSLAEDVHSLDEVVVVGYGTQKKINLTGAVAQVDEKLISNRAVTNIGQALQGTVANLNISQTNNGGAPGSGVNYNIRGATSLSSDGSPFFVVDGIPVDNIQNINPADVKNITVLKDAAASAIYGARAAYGVILITTKSGSKNEKATISYNNMFGFNSATNIPDQVNSLEFAEAYNIASLNAGQSPMFSGEHIDRIKAYLADPVNTPVNVPNPNNPDFWSYATLDNDNVDWWRAYFKSGTRNQKHDISVSGGGENSTYYVGAGYFNEGGLLRYGDEKFERFNLTSNLRVEPLKWLRTDLRVRFSRSHRDVPSPTHDPSIGNWVHLATTRFPNWMLKDPNGHWALTSQMQRQWEGRGIDNTNMLNLTGAIELEPVKNWKINVDYTYRGTAYKQTAQAKPFAWEHTVSEVPVMLTNNAYSAEMSQTNYNSLNAYTSFQKELGGHFFTVLAGQQIELNKYSYLSGIRRDLIVPEIPSMGVATGDQGVSESLSHWANMGSFARLNYNYEEKYLIEFNARYDGTSKFPEGNRFGFFPSVSLGYNIAEENFWTFKEQVNFFKIRASYGSLGNQAVPNYLYLNTIPIGSKYPYIINGVRPNYLGTPGLVSPDLTWETASTIDIGLDAAFLHNKLALTFDWYKRTTTDMFGPANALPATLGANVPQTNNADLETKGFELNLQWRDNIGKDISYYVNVIFSDYTSTVTRYNNPTKILSTFYEGKTLGEIWGYTTEGIIQTDEQLATLPDQSIIYGNWTKGDIAYKDLDGNGVVDFGDNTLDDHGDLRVIGNTNPRYSYGISMGGSWKGFDLTLFLQGVGKRDFSPPTGGNRGVFFWGFTGGFGSNMYDATSDFWTPDNTDAYLPKPYNSGEVRKNQQTQTRYLQSASYLRLKNLQIGYTVPGGLGLQKIRIFVSGENLLTFTSLQENFDPELTHGSDAVPGVPAWGAGKIYPLMKTMAFGVNIDF